MGELSRKITGIGQRIPSVSPAGHGKNRVPQVEEVEQSGWGCNKLFDMLRQCDLSYGSVDRYQA
jgi:hypothetical protein